MATKQTDISKIKLINKLLAKEFYKEYRSILTDFYRIYISLMESYTEIEDLFSNIIKIAKQESRV